jgi:hypothetical protein
MQYTIAIAGNNVSASQLNMVLTIDKTLDYGSFAVRNQVAEPYAVGDMVDIDITDGVDTKSYHFIISADDVTQLPNGYYLHTINIIELTKRLEWHTESIRTFTQRLEGDKLSLLDVVTALQFTAPIEKVSNLANTRIFALDNDLRPILANIESPDFQFNNKNLKEILMEVFDFIDAIPRLVKIANSITLTADFYNDRGQVITEDAFYRMKRFDINDYSTSLDAEIRNLYDSYTDIAEPSDTGFKRLSTTEGYLRETNAFLATQYPIVEVESLKIKVNVSGSGVVLPPSFAGTLDITNYIVEREEWDLLTNKKFSLAVDSGRYRDNTLFFTRFSPNITNLFEVVGAVSIAEFLTRATETRINNVIRDAVFKQEGFVVTNFQDFDELEFQIVYKAQIDSRTEVKRLDTSATKYDSQSYIGQTDNVVRADRVLDRLFKLQQLLGNAQIMTSERATAVDDLFELSDVTTDDYVLTTIEMDCSKKYINAKYMWSKNYQKVSEFIGLNNEIRLYDIPRDSFKRNMYLEDFVEVGTTEVANDSIVGSNGIAAFMNTFSNNPNTFDNLPVRLFAFNSKSTVEFSGYDNEVNTLIKPITAYAGGNTLNFHVEFDNSTVVGNQLDLEVERLEPPLNKPIIYTDDNGLVYDFDFKFVNNATITTSENLPIVAKTDLQSPLFDGVNYRIFKDTREIFALTYALHVIPGQNLENKIIIGKYLVERNNLLKSISTAFGQFEVFGTNTPYTLADNRFSRSTDTVVAQTYSIAGRRLMLSGTVAFSTWGIRRVDTKELVIAVNQGGTPITSLWFNFRDRQTGVLYPNQTSQPSFLVGRPTNIQLIPPTNNPTDTTISVVWQDSNISPTATQFEFGISDDFVNWTSETATPQVTNAKTFTGLLPNTRYLIRVRAFINSDFSEYAYFEATTTAPAPNAPTNLQLTLLGDRRILATWDEADDDVFLYRIEASTSSGFGTLIDGGLKTTFFNDTQIIYDSTNADIDFDTQYFFRVRSLRDNLFSPYSNVANITTSESPITAAPLLTNISVSGSNVTFTLVNTDDQLVTLFADFSTATTSRATGVRPNEARTFTIAFTTQTTLFARAKAALKENSAIVAEDFAPGEAPAAPNIGATAIVTNSGFNVVNYTYETTDPIVDGFVVERNPDALNNNQFGEVSQQLPPTARRFIDLRVLSGQSYTYRVRAINRLGTTLSNERTVTSVATVPNAPSNLTASAVLAGAAGEGFFTLTWQRNSTDEDGFLVERKLSTQGAGSFAVVGGTSRGQVTIDQTIQGDPNTTYDYRIIAFNEFGNSTPSNTVSVFIA